MPAVSGGPDEGELRTLTQLVLDICEVGPLCLLGVLKSLKRFYFQELIPNFATLITDPFGSHVARSLLLLLSPNLSMLEGTQSAVRSKKSASWKAKQGHMKSVFDDEKTKGKDSITRSVPPEFRQMARRFVEVIRTQLGENEVRAMAASKVACPALMVCSHTNL